MLSVPSLFCCVIAFVSSLLSVSVDAFLRRPLRRPLRRAFCTSSRCPSGRFFESEMSAERASFGLDTLIPETCKSKAEAFAKCLQHKLLSLGRTQPPPEPGRRLNGEGRAEGEKPREGCGSAGATWKKTDDSEEGSHSPSESESGNSERGTRQRKLTSMSSEESTVDSWSSCQENLTDSERLDSEAEEGGSLAAQIKGSPSPGSFNVRAKRKELREKTWKKNGRRNHSSSTESVDSEGVRQSHGRRSDGFESGSRYVLPDDDVPHRILRESSSTSSLERHFCRRESDGNSFKLEGKAGSDFLTPPPSPDAAGRKQDLSSRMRFARIETEAAASFVEAECLNAVCVEDLIGTVKKVGGVLVECASDETEVDFAEKRFVVTRAEVLQDAPRDGSPERRDERPKEDIETAEDDDILSSRSRMRRCSSLKTWKTPPGTPGAKKIVRFADALGLDLADVRTFPDEIPRIPRSAYEGLQFDFPKCELAPPPPRVPSTLLPSFRQPATEPDFLERVRNRNICLESTAVILEGVPTVTGFVRVRNLGFQKSVHVRYTLNDWETYSDLQATYVPSSCDGFSDRFSFSLYGHTLKVGEKLEFALRLECCGAQYWDNNGGANYVFRCLPRTSVGGFFFSPCSSQPDPWFDFY